MSVFSGPTFRPLRHRQYALYWTGNFISNIGTWMETVALGYYVASTTGKATWAAIIAAAGFVPTGLLSPIGGVLADRVAKKPLLLASTVVQMLCAAVLAVLAFTGDLRPLIATCVVFVAGCAGAMSFPAYQSAMRDLVPPEDIPAAIGLGSAQWNLGRILGPTLAGVVIKFGGIGWALVVNTVSFMAVVATLLLITLSPSGNEGQRGGWFTSLRDGFNFVRREPGLRVASLAMIVNTFLAAPFIGLLPAMVENVLKREEGTVALLVTCQGVGAVIAALMLGSLTQRYGLRRMLTFNLVAVPITVIAYGAAPGVIGKSITLVLLGASYLLALSTFSSIAQLRSTNEMRGRSLAVNTTILGLLYPAGALLQGRLGDRIGLSKTTIYAGVAMLIIVGGTRLARPGMTAPLSAE